MKAWSIYVISSLYTIQAIQCWVNKQYPEGFLVFCYAMAGIPLIYMIER